MHLLSSVINNVLSTNSG